MTINGVVSMQPSSRRLLPRFWEAELGDASRALRNLWGKGVEVESVERGPVQRARCVLELLRTSELYCKPRGLERCDSLIHAFWCLTAPCLRNTHSSVAQDAGHRKESTHHLGPITAISFPLLLPALEESKKTGALGKPHSPTIVTTPLRVGARNRKYLRRT